ncbi:large subunit ribosomal protein L28 [Deinobacterium chartae]|uniref:Large subunit ribosomal protein L28 n=1 Tax=Deinobacterium chartae TaxID=521158 RepID=A0A841I0S9_9DEIO|nr:L28 family ribosomal protein [Deinobacterium chartae]MBB6097878.1 large subunit ribosomal protein L28 [Deinobacterium chartae]
MSKKCFVTGKSTVVVNSVVRRGKPKSEGGVGRKTTGISKVRKYANLQKKTVLVDGVRQKVWLSAKALRRLPENITIIR